MASTQHIFDDEEMPVTASMLVPASTAEQRAHPRYALALMITMSGDNNFYVGLSENISEGGIFIATHHVIPLGTKIVMTFVLPTSSRPLTVHGTVRWLRGWDAVEDTSGELPSIATGMGIRFDSLDDATAAEIHDFVRQRRPEFFDE